MKTRKLRLLSFVLAVAMMFVMMPVGAFADNPSPTEGECGANGDHVHWNYDSGVLTISGTGAMADYRGDYNLPPWYGWKQEITKIVIIDGVTTIGKMAFYGYQETEIALPNSVTSIGKAAFCDCEKLQGVKLPPKLTDIGEDAFRNCSALKEIQIPSGVKTIGAGAFWYCTNLGSVTISDGVTDIGAYAFHNCSDLESIDIPSSVTNIGEKAFSDCSKLMSIDIPSSVTNIGKEAFFNCKNLASVTNMNGVTNIGEGAFRCCTGLMSIDIPSSVTNIGAWAFAWCEGLTSIDIPSSVTSIREDAFFYCTSLKNVTIPSSVTSIENETFGWCTSLENVAIPSSVTTIGADAFALCATLKKITIPQQVEEIGAEAFTGCAQLEKIDIESDSQLNTVGDYAFETNCLYQSGACIAADSSALTAFLAQLGITIPQFAETKIYCDAPLKKSGKLSDKGVAEKNIIASVTVKLVDGEQTKIWNVPYGGTVGTLEKPTKEGYTFVDWYDEKENVFDPAAPLTEDTTIHAEWKKDAAPAPTPAPTPAPAPVDDDSVDAGAVATTVVLGAGVAALTYHIGTELYAEQVLGKGVVVPTLRGDVARKAWELAGKPAVTVAGNEAPDEDAQAQQWVVDQGLMKDREDGKFHPEQRMSKLKALRTLDAAKKLG